MSLVENMNTLVDCSVPFIITNKAKNNFVYQLFPASSILLPGNLQEMTRSSFKVLISKVTIGFVGFFKLFLRLEIGVDYGRCLQDPSSRTSAKVFRGSRTVRTATHRTK